MIQRDPLPDHSNSVREQWAFSPLERMALAWMTPPPHQHKVSLADLRYCMKISLRATERLAEFLVSEGYAEWCPRPYLRLTADGHRAIDEGVRRQAW